MLNWHEYAYHIKYNKPSRKKTSWDLCIYMNGSYHFYAASLLLVSWNTCDFKIKITEIIDILSSFIDDIEYVQWRFRGSVCGIKHPQE